MADARPWSRLVDYWLECGIPRQPGAPTDGILRFESEYGVVLPPDVREYFQAVNGTGQDTDAELNRFWPLGEVKPVWQELRDVNPDRFAYPDCFVFADHCISCWDYAVRLTKDPTQPAPAFRVTGSDPPGEQMAPSFLDFMMRYIADPTMIYA